MFGFLRIFICYNFLFTLSLYSVEFLLPLSICCSNAAAGFQGKYHPRNITQTLGKRLELVDVARNELKEARMFSYCTWCTKNVHRFLVNSSGKNIAWIDSK